MEILSTIQESSSLGMVAGRKMTRETYEKLVNAWRRSNDLLFIRILGFPELDSKTVYDIRTERDADGHYYPRFRKIPIPDFEELI